MGQAQVVENLGRALAYLRCVNTTYNNNEDSNNCLRFNMNLQFNLECGLQFHLERGLPFHLERGCL